MRGNSGVVSPVGSFSSATGRRRRSLIRPERRSRSRRQASRSRTRELGIREHDFGDGEGLGDDGVTQSWWGRCWPTTTRLLTCCVPGWALSKCGGMRDPRIQGAWREKVSLCLLVLVLCLALGFLTFGFTTIVCRPPAKPVYKREMVEGANGRDTRWFLVHGHIFNVPERAKPHIHSQLTFDPYKRYATKDLSVLFPYSPTCQAMGVRFKCKLPGDVNEYCHKPQDIEGHDHVGEVAWDWPDVAKGRSLFVYNGAVYDLAVYLDQVPANSKKFPFGGDVDLLLRSVLGKDATKAFLRLDKKTIGCLEEQFRVGVLQVKTIGCITTDIILYVSLIAILSLVLAKFFLAVGFSILMARRLGSRRALEKRLVSDQRVQASVVDGTVYTPNNDNNDNNNNVIKTSNTRTILLVTCYSEGELGLRTTLDSLTETDYPDDMKLIVVIADGIIRGSGNSRSTPDILIEMMELADDLFEPYYFDANGQPEAHSYIAIADGVRRHNMARVYAGWYRSGGHRVPMLLIVKCGAPEEAQAVKPGNRGKRDSQIILMSFLAKVLFDDRMTPLEYDIFYKIWRLTGVTSDLFELVLMVDADTQVDKGALEKLVLTMRSDDQVMGLCGETQIENALHSWVTAIQVFEYYISHHLSKAFESIFGGVTCLPGCFCMYRIKAPKHSIIIEEGMSQYWVPILASPDIVDAYSENVTNTLHKKNLLLLGEDRYLTTLMLKTFPKRKMLFVPQALCRTIVPDTFKVLLSQRRRWINSTIHNLFELVLVPDLCGTFCCSMQFVIFMELVGTLVLPAAIVFTGVLITSSFIRKPEWIPLGLLAAILGLPALLILFTTRRPAYILWFSCYILALPLWNFVLPAYAFWHFDDFSWGETRKVDSNNAPREEEQHGMAHGRFDHSQITLRRWHEYEGEREAKRARFEAGVRALREGGVEWQSVSPRTPH